MYADKDDNYVCKECYKKARGWIIRILITNTGKKEANEVYRRIENLTDKLTSIGPTIKISINYYKFTRDDIKNGQ